MNGQSGVSPGLLLEADGAEGYAGDDSAPQDPRTRLANLRVELERAEAFRRGAENLLHEVGAGQGKTNGDLHVTVEAELSRAVSKVKALQKEIEYWEPLAVASPRHPPRNYGQPPPSPSIVIRSEPSEAEARMAIGKVRTKLLELKSASSPRDIVQALSSIIEILTQLSQVRYELPMEQALESVLGFLSDTQPQEVRCNAYRLFRHVVVDSRDVVQLCEAGVEVFLLKSLSKDSKGEPEKQQALLLFRTMISVPRGTRCISVGLIRCIVALAESPEEKLKLLSLESLTELLIRDIGALAAAQGIKIVMTALAEGPVELAPYLAAAVMAIVDRPEGRQYLRAGFDFETALAGFNEVTNGRAQEARIRACVRLVTFMLKSWTGLLYLCTNQKRSLRMYVDTLSTSTDKARSILLEGLFEIFYIKSPSWFNSFMAGKRLTYYQKPTATGVPVHADIAKEGLDKSSDKVTLIQHYMALVLLVFVDVGLLEALVTIAENKTSEDLSRKASLLIAELLDLCIIVLPSQSGSRLQALPKLFEMASSFDMGESRLAATSALRAVDSLHRTKERLNDKPIVTTTTATTTLTTTTAAATAMTASAIRLRSNSLEDSLRTHGQRHVESTRIRLGIQIDDVGFRNLLMETQVLVTKDHTKWSIEKLLELVEGPLLNPKRLEEVVKSSKIMRRLLGFFHPFEGRYPYIKRIKQNSRYTRLACSTLQTLLSDASGVKFLSEDRLIDQIGQCFRQLEPLSNTAANDIVFAQDRVEETLTYGYFEMLGVLSRHAEGVKLLEKAKIFTSFYSLCEMRSRDDLIKAVIENIDYEIIGHARIVLSKALTSSYKHVRLFATHHLERLIKDIIGSKTWLIKLLLTQLHDPCADVCGLAVEMLEDWCEDEGVLEIVVQLRPSLENLGEVGAPLLLRFLSTSIGARYLSEIDWTSREMDDWFHTRNQDYVIQIEMYLAKTLDADGTRDEEDEETISHADGTAPPHFYGQVVKTEEGRQLLNEKGHFVEFADFIRMFGLESEDVEILSKLKSILWAVGHIGSSDAGLVFLEQEGMIESIIEISEESPVLSIRGTCYFVLGLISQSPQAPDLLAEFGWESALTTIGLPTGVCVPKALDAFVVIPGWQTRRPASKAMSYVGHVKGVRRHLLDSISNLSNQLVANNASKNLARLRSKRRELFGEVQVFKHALELISSHHYKLPTRRYVLELFGEVVVDGHVAAGVRDSLGGECGEVGSEGAVAAGSGSSRLVRPTPMFNAYDRVDVNSDSDDDDDDDEGGDDDEYDDDDDDDDDGDSHSLDRTRKNRKLRRKSSPPPAKRHMEPLIVIRGFLL